MHHCITKWTTNYFEPPQKKTVRYNGAEEPPQDAIHSPFIIDINKRQRHAMEERIKESYYWQQADKKVIKETTMREKGKARFLRHNSREYCLANQSVYCTEQGWGGAAFLSNRFDAKRNLKHKNIFTMRHILLLSKHRHPHRTVSTTCRLPTIQGVFLQKHLRGCHTAQCFRLHLARCTKVQVLSSWLFCIWKTATADCNR